MVFPAVLLLPTHRLAVLDGVAVSPDERLAVEDERAKRAEEASAAAAAAAAAAAEAAGEEGKGGDDE